MATGIQTSVQRGRRSQLSAKPTPNQSPWSKAGSIWSGLDKKVKYGIGGLVLLSLFPALATWLPGLVFGS